MTYKSPEQEHENPFPEWTTMGHELGHCIVAWQVTVGSGIVFYPRHPREKAMAEYSQAGVSAANRVLIAVAGAVGQQEIGRMGLCSPQPNPEDVFLSEPNNVLPEFSGDYETVQIFAPQVSSKLTKVILAEIARCRQMVEAVGGGPLIVALGRGVFRWLEEEDRKGWKTALDDHYSFSGVSFVEARLHKLLLEVAAEDPALAPGCGLLVARIEKAIAARAAPPQRH